MVGVAVTGQFVEPWICLRKILDSNLETGNLFEVFPGISPSQETSMNIEP